jgi:hypothetical protein
MISSHTCTVVLLYSSYYLGFIRRNQHFEFYSGISIIIVYPDFETRAQHRYKYQHFKLEFATRYVHTYSTARTAGGAVYFYRVFGKLRGSAGDVLGTASLIIISLLKEDLGS